ncbi:MAG: hypothetical protein ACI9KM_002070 [Rubritalea sp.]|jgi:hypothetical protein
MNRKNSTWLSAAILVTIITFSPHSFADDSAAGAWQQEDDKWLSFTTEHFQFNYHEAHQVQADRAAVIAEKVWPVITSDLNWEPIDRIQVVIEDDFDFSNGFASPLPYNQVRLFLSPPENMSGLAPYDDWMNLLITHELTHVVQLDMAMGAPSVMRKILGRNIFTFPHTFTPGFMTEGLAVYKETNHQAGYGRGQSSRYEMLMRGEVIGGIDDLSRVTVPLRDWPFGKQYLYGYYYYEFLAERYGQQKITQYLNSYSRKLLPFVLQNRTAKRTFGKSHETLWPEFKSWLKLKFAPQIKQIEHQPLIAGTAFTNDGLQFDPITANDNQYYYLHSNGMDRRSIVKVDADGNHNEVMSVSNIIDMDVTEKDSLLITRLVLDGDGRAWSDIFQLSSGDEKRLTHGQRYRTARWLSRIPNKNTKQNTSDAKRIIAKRIVGGYSQLDLLSADGQFIKQLWRGTLDDVVGDYSVSHDGEKLIASVKRKQQGWNLEQFDLNSNQWGKLTNTKATESGARFDKGDKTILFSADYDGVFNIYRMNLSSGEVQQLSHVMGGAIKPAQVGNRIFYQNYSAMGYNHYQLPIEENIKTFNIANQSESYHYSDWYQQPLNRSEPEDYSLWPTLRPRRWFPIIAINAQLSQIGVVTTGTDALSRHSYVASISHDAKNELTAVGASYFYDDKWVLLAQRSHYYTTLANTGGLNVRRADDAELVRINILSAFEDALDFSTGISIGNQTDLARLGLTRLFTDSKRALLGIRLDFDNRESYSQSISPSWGNRSSVTIETNDAFDSDFKGEVYNANISQLFDLPGNQVLVINVSGAYSTDSADSTRLLSLGGEKSNIIEPLFGRDTWALRGYDASVQTGTRIQTNSIDYRFPITNIERNWNLIPIGVGQISSTVFIENGAAWGTGGQVDYLSAVGLEIKTELIIAYGVALPVNLGYAYGLDDTKGGSRAYARIGYTF